MSTRIALVAVVAASLSPVAAADEIFVSGYSSDSVVRYEEADGAFIGPLEPGVGLDGTLGTAIGPEGRIYVCSENSNEILRYEAGSGAFVDVFIAPGNGLNGASAIVFGPDANDDGAEDAYVASFNSDSILVYDGTSGAFIDVFVSASSGGLNGPDAGMAFGPNGNLFVPSYWGNAVLEYDGTSGSFAGAFVSSGGGGLFRPRTVVFRDDGHVLVTSEGNDRVIEYDADGEFVDTLITGLPDPTGMTVAPDGTLLVASLGLNEVRRYDAFEGTFLGVAVDASASHVSAMTYVLVVPSLEGDVNGDGAIDVQDIILVIVAWGPCPACAADLNDDGTVDVLDLLIVILNW